MTTNYTPFDGDGRRKVNPVNARALTRPMPVTNAQARRLIDALVKQRASFHSASGSTLWVIEHWARTSGACIVVTVQSIDGRIGGYALELMN